jgi:hypothetical protein
LVQRELSECGKYRLKEKVFILVLGRSGVITYLERPPN